MTDDLYIIKEIKQELSKLAEVDRSSFISTAKETSLKASLMLCVSMIEDYLRLAPIRFIDKSVKLDLQTIFTLLLGIVEELGEDTGGQNTFRSLLETLRAARDKELRKQIEDVDV